jgi:ribosome-interacting GTPase 1
MPKDYDLHNPALFISPSGKILTRTKAKKTKGVVTKIISEDGVVIEEIPGVVDLTDKEVQGIITRYEVQKTGTKTIQKILDEYPELAEIEDIEELDIADDSEDFYSEERIQYYATQRFLKPEALEVHYYNPKKDETVTVVGKLRDMSNEAIWTVANRILNKIRNKGQYYWIVLKMKNPDGTFSFRSLCGRTGL